MLTLLHGHLLVDPDLLTLFAFAPVLQEKYSKQHIFIFREEIITDIRFFWLFFFATGKTINSVSLNTFLYHFIACFEKKCKLVFCVNQQTRPIL